MRPASRLVRSSAIFAGIALLAGPAASQPVVPRPASDTAATDAATAFAANTGTLLHLFDRAAWVASDALTAAIPRDALTGAGGYVVERGEDDGLLVTFFRGEGAAETVRRGYRPCSAAPFNTVTIPPASPDGPIGVYLLTAQTDTDSYPLGGHYRVVVQRGAVISHRRFSNACLEMKVPVRADGAKPAGLFVSHLLDAVPTEIHVFTSYAARLPVFVGTPDGRVWQVAGPRITPSTMKAPPPPRPEPRPEPQRAS